MPRQLAATSASTPKASESSRYAARLRWRKARKWVTKLSAATSMKKISTASISGESKWPTLVSWVEKPPRLMVAKAWQTASNQSIPASRSATAHTPVRAAYIVHSSFAVSAIRGVSLLSLIGPGSSAFSSWRPPTPRSGRIATASTMMPMPPSHCSRCRHRLSEGGRLSSPLITVPPVVVSAEIASKYASVKLICGA